jgi:predicted DNA-binding WGR domain protein
MKTVKFLAVAIVLFGCTLFAQTAQAQTKYWVVFASYDDPNSNDPMYAATDVVKTVCDINRTAVLLQYNKHIDRKYDDVFGRSEGNTSVEAFDTQDKALNWRKKKIAEKENKDYEVVKVSGFSIYCDD